MSEPASKRRVDRAGVVASLDRAVAFLLVVSSLVSVATCAQRGHAPEVAPASPAKGEAGAPTPSATPASPPGSTAPSAPAGQGSPSVSSAPAGPLATFEQALSALRARTREESVRVLWLGDSHTAADFMSDRVRGALSKELGAGGPGFVRLGVSPYRHGRMRFEIGGKWHRTPEQPSRRSRVQDGVFGLCGMRSVPDAGAWTSARSFDSGLARGGKVTWSLLHRMPKGAALKVSLGARTTTLDDQTATEEVPGSSIRRLHLEGGVADELRIDHLAGAPELFGAYVEGDTPGVVIDTCGIDGARVATALAWDSASWQAEVRARKPDLLLIAFGTNEAFDEGRVERYAGEYTELLSRARAAVPNLPCLVLGPPDAAERGGGTKERVLEVTAVQQKAAAELGCAFVSALALMGGEGSFAAWMNAEPPLAKRDRVHLTTPGYERLGEGIIAALMPGYAQPAPASAAQP